VVLPGEYRRLLEAVLAGTPRLSDALCAGYPDVFDAPDGKFDDDTRARIAFAQSCCRCCPRAGVPKVG